MITDSTGRSFKKLRISLTHECNYACIYCVDESGNAEREYARVEAGATSRLLPSSELIEIIRNLHSLLGLDSVRITGGEPLLQPRIITIIRSIRDMGIQDIGMTTNGHLLANKAQILFNSGLNSVNISLDALSPEIFTQVAQHSGLPNVLKAIDSSLAAGLSVKLNAVIIAGKNHSEILPLLRFGIKTGVVVRFLEYMPMGTSVNGKTNMFFSRSQMLDIIRSAFSIERLPGEMGATADYWTINGRKAFGIIANTSKPFCNDCNRLRLDSYGNVYGCLSSLIPLRVTSVTSPKELGSLLKEALSHKQPVHFKGNVRTMKSIGG